MISFAVAKDQTYVAQTIGRMVRTPLARKIGTNSFLNTVSLYLPRFDADAVENVVKGLNDGDGSVTSDVIIEGEIVPRNPNITQEVWDAVGNLPTYSRASKHHKNEVARMNKMAFLLNGAGIDKNAIIEARGMIISTLSAHVESIDKLKEKEAAVRNADIIKVEISLTGEEEITSENSDTPRSPQDLDNLFRVAKRILPDNVAMSYWNALCEEEE
jgi:type III restriction enzyme